MDRALAPPRTDPTSPTPPDGIRFRAEHVADHPVATVARTARYILTGADHPPATIERDELHDLRCAVATIRRLVEAGQADNRTTVGIAAVAAALPGGA